MQLSDNKAGDETASRNSTNPSPAEFRLQGLIALSTEAIISTDEQQRIVLFNRGAEEMFGYGAEEVLGQPLGILLPPAVREAHRGHLAAMLAEGDSSRRMGDRAPVRGRRKSGEEFEAHISISTLRLGGESVATAVVRDVSVLRAAELALRRSEVRYRTLVDASPAGIFTVSLHGVVVDGNPAFARMLGAASPADLRGESLARRFARPGEWDAILSSLEVSGMYALSEHTLLRMDGAARRLLIRAIRSLGEDGDFDLVHGFALDVTERRQLEETLRRSEQLEAVGQLAGGVAHDFNNLLSVIRMCAAFIAEEPSLSVSAHHDVAELERAATRASELTQQLLAVGRRQVMRPRNIDLGGIVRRSLGLFARLLGEDVTLTATLFDGPSRVFADEAQIERVLVNLVTNARDAMPAGGAAGISVTVENPGAEDLARCPELAPGPHVRLTVRDSGVGMDDATRARIFEPFFSTKGESGGMGLGLASAYGIVAQSGGGIIVDSSPGEGTAFNLWFPSRGSTPVEPVVAVPALVERPTFALPLVVLVIEDDPGVRSMVARVLRSRGITVLDAPDARTALRLAEQHPGPIDAVVSDVVLPGLSGQQAIDLIAQRHPDVGVLFMSGYSGEAVRNHGRLRPGSEMIAKPFRPDDLLSALARLMGRGEA